MHADGAERIARIAAQSGVPRLVHVSHLNASASSKSKFYQTKAEGEERVKAAFDGATIIRPGPLYGYEDKLLNNMASTLHRVQYNSRDLFNDRVPLSSLANLVEAERCQDKDPPRACMYTFHPAISMKVLIGP